MTAPLPAGYVRDAVERALSEDLGGRGDVTTLATIPADASARFEIAARGDVVAEPESIEDEHGVSRDPDALARRRQLGGRFVDVGVETPLL